MTTAHLMHGFLGTGKTTFAKALEAQSKALRFSHDEWMVSLYGQDPPAVQFSDNAGRVYRLMEGVWQRCLGAGVDVILDWGFWTRDERDQVRATVAGLGAELRLYRLNCPDELARQRVGRRNTGPASLYIAPATYDLLRTRFELLDEDEARIEIDSGNA